MKRNTVQKEIICRTVRSMTDHPSSDEVYGRIHEEHPSISRATVYRVLNSMADEGLLRKVTLPDTACRFDCRTEDHIHFRCTKCGKVFDVDTRGSGDILRQIGMFASEGNGSEDFQVNGFTFSLEGLCGSCREEVK